MPKFIHADLIAQYLEDANECEEPWLRWQCRHELSGGWVDATHPLSFLPDVEYRRKPKTILINGIEVPEPVRKPLERGCTYWVAESTATEVRRYEWFGDAVDFQWLADGLVHMTKEAAQQHIDALLSFTRRGGE